jgi:hypothetical protein
MQINDDVVCAWSGIYTSITTGKTYRVDNVFEDHGNEYITVLDDNGKRASYDSCRFMKLTDQAQQLKENLING